LSLPDVNFVAHTHPTAVNIITCARDGEEVVKGRLFPDEIVCCGVAPVWVPYTDPGIPLARKVKAQIEAYVEEYGMRPKTILMQNHGLIAIGTTPSEVENACYMMVKTARVLVGTYALGGPHTLTPQQVERIFSRPDEKYRIALLEKR
jgi:rhamnose utilization protein RhaD (predicted bifunctional aldolase and dehydrogenase)